MKIAIAVYVEARRRQKGANPHFNCRPLFGALEIQGEAPNVHAAIQKLTQRLSDELKRSAKSRSQELLARISFLPDYDSERITVSSLHGDSTRQVHLLLVHFRSGDRQIAFSPTLPDLWFDVPRDMSVEFRANEVFTQHVRAAKHAGCWAPEEIELPADYDEAWTTEVNINVDPPMVPAAQHKSKALELFGGTTEFDGGVELRRVGRCLNWLYPDGLRRALCRDKEVIELQRLLTASDGRPLMLVGPHAVGKSTILHEVVYQMQSQEQRKKRSRENIWLLSPQRLISGMMHVGEWESRLLAILDEAKTHRYRLYFDDVLGLYSAGISRDSSLCAADILKQHIQQRSVRVIAEMTPAEFQVLRERDRAMADAFHVFRIEEPSEEQNLRMLLHAVRDLETRFVARFHHEVLPTVIETQRRFNREVAFPGKAAKTLHALAMKHQHADVDRSSVLQAFRDEMGVATWLLDDSRPHDREQIVEALRRRIIGQDAALEAAADTILTARARLSHPDRPLATLLLLGPTGVGKTELAKTLAAYLFGSAERLVRFDMNEYSSPQAVTQLVGTSSQPDGLLTSDIRRQPFSVILLDEIEKAHPDAFDVLLQVLGEARLTDARGRTTDFSNTIVIMTSNLGTDIAGRALGFVDGEVDQSQVFLRATEQFFRPEFVNRLDRIIPFAPLSRETIGSVARILLRDVFGRDGFLRRRCVLHVEEDALQEIVDKGLHPQLGARALKRALERELVQPTADKIVTVRTDVPALIHVYAGPAKLTVDVVPLGQIAAAPASQYLVHEERLDQVVAEVATMEEPIVRGRPTHEITVGSLTAEDLRYFALREQLQQVEGTARQIRDWTLAKQSRVDPPPFSPKFRRSRMKYIGGSSVRRVLVELASVEDVHEYLHELFAAGVTYDNSIEKALLDLGQEVDLLKAMIASDQDQDRIVLVLNPLIPARDSLPGTATSGTPLNGDPLRDDAFGADCRDYARLYTKLYSECFDMETHVLSEHLSREFPQAVLQHVNGPFAQLLTRAEAGIHLFIDEGGSLMPFQVAVVSVGTAGPEQVVERLCAARRNWLGGLREGTRVLEDNPLPLGKVIRIFQRDGAVIDLRSGMSLPGPPTVRELQTIVLANAVAYTRAARNQQSQSSLETRR